VVGDTSAWLGPWLHRYPVGVSARYRLSLDALIAEATLDCRDEQEAVIGFLTVIQDNLVVPFQTEVLGVGVMVDDIGLNAAEDIVAICSRGEHRQAIALIDLPLPADAPGGVEWIEAYRRWRT
jgi:hypothetical protein